MDSNTVPDQVSGVFMAGLSRRSLGEGGRQTLQRGEGTWIEDVLPVRHE